MWTFHAFIRVNRKFQNQQNRKILKIMLPKHGMIFGLFFRFCMDEGKIETCSTVTTILFKKNKIKLKLIQQRKKNNIWKQKRFDLENEREKKRSQSNEERERDYHYCSQTTARREWLHQTIVQFIINNHSSFWIIKHNHKVQQESPSEIISCDKRVQLKICVCGCLFWSTFLIVNRKNGFVISIGFITILICFLFSW